MSLARLERTPASSSTMDTEMLTQENSKLEKDQRRCASCCDCVVGEPFWGVATIGDGEPLLPGERNSPSGANRTANSTRVPWPGTLFTTQRPPMVARRV